MVSYFEREIENVERMIYDELKKKTELTKDITRLKRISKNKKLNKKMCDEMKEIIQKYDIIDPVDEDYIFINSLVCIENEPENVYKRIDALDTLRHVQNDKIRLLFEERRNLKQRYEEYRRSCYHTYVDKRQVACAVEQQLLREIEELEAIEDVMVNFISHGVIKIIR